MRPISIAVAASAIGMQVLILLSTSAFPVSLELATKCRGLAIKAHPPQRAGTKAYATAEREFFNRCISANGEQNENKNADRPPQESR
jgi:hypothetical protein